MTRALSDADFAPPARVRGSISDVAIAGRNTGAEVREWLIDAAHKEMAAGRWSDAAATIELYLAFGHACARARPSELGLYAARAWRREGLDLLCSFSSWTPDGDASEFLAQLSVLERCLDKYRPTNEEFRRYLEGSARDAVADLPKAPVQPHVFGAYLSPDEGPWSWCGQRPKLIAALYYKPNRTARLLVRETRRAAAGFGHEPFEPIRYEDHPATHFSIRISGNSLGASTAEMYSGRLQSQIRKEAYQRLRFHGVRWLLRLTRYRIQLGDYPPSLEELEDPLTPIVEPLTGARFALRSEPHGPRLLIATASPDGRFPMLRPQRFTRVLPSASSGR